MRVVLVVLMRLALAQAATPDALFDAARNGDRAQGTRTLDGGIDVCRRQRPSRSEDGDGFVVRAGREDVELGKRPMNEVIMATPAISDGVFVLRTLGTQKPYGTKSSPSIFTCR